MDEENLIKWNDLGLICSENETEEEFARRAEYCLNLTNQLEEYVGTELPLDQAGLASPEILEEASNETQTLYGIKPAWVPVFFSNEKLSAWQGGAAWIFQWDETSSLGALIQLRKSFEKKEVYLGLWSRKELLTHELAHVGRMGFEEKKYEEVLAYRSSKRFFTRYFGPLFQSSFESMSFVLLLMAIVFIDVLLLATGSVDFFDKLMWLKAVPAVFLGALCVRLWRRQRNFGRTREKLVGMYGETGNFILYRLLDQEIDAFSRMSNAEIQAYLTTPQSLRTKQLFLRYLK